MNQAEADCLAANAYTELALHDTDARRAKRQAARAEHYVIDACEQRGESYTRSRVLDEVRLGKVRLAQREPDEAVNIGLHSLSFAQGVRSSVVVDWLLRFDGDLHGRYPTLPSVQEFHGELTAYVRDTAPHKDGSLRDAGP